MILKTYSFRTRSFFLSSSFLMTSRLSSLSLTPVWRTLWMMRMNVFRCRRMTLLKKRWRILRILPSSRRRILLKMT